MRIMIIDSNLVYAKQVKRILEDLIKNADICIATNIWQLERRIENNGPFSLILLDLLTVASPDEVMSYLAKIDVPKIIWSTFDSLSGLNEEDRERISKIVNKPSIEELRKTIAMEIVPTFT